MIFLGWLWVFIKAVPTLVSALPTMLKVYNTMREQMHEQEVQSRVKIELQKIHEAYEEKNAEKLKSTFDS